MSNKDIVTRLWLPALATLVAACGGSPATPSSPPATPSSIRIIASSSLLPIGATLTLSAEAIANGTAIDVSRQSRWISDSPKIAPVDEAGKVTGVTAGRATVIATYGGVSAALLLRVIPELTGTWRGTGHSTECTGFPDFRTCSRFVPVGSTGAFTLVVSQTADAATAQIELRVTPPPTATMAFPSFFVGQLAGLVLDDGTLSLDGPTLSRQPGLDDFPLGSIVGWQTVADATGTLSGTFRHVFASTFPSGSIGRIGWTVDRLVRTAR